MAPQYTQVAYLSVNSLLNYLQPFPPNVLFRCAIVPERSSQTSYLLFKP